MWETVIQKLELNFQLDKIVDFLFFFWIFLKAHLWFLIYLSI